MYLDGYRRFYMTKRLRNTFAGRQIKHQVIYTHQRLPP